MSDRAKRLKRARKSRVMIKKSSMPRLAVYRTPRHIYAQIISIDGSKVLAAAGTNEAEFKKSCAQTGNIEAAKALGEVIAERAKKAGFEKVAFDRSGFKFHGRVKALADMAKANGLIF